MAVKSGKRSSTSSNKTVESSDTRSSDSGIESHDDEGSSSGGGTLSLFTLGVSKLKNLESE